MDAGKLYYWMDANRREISSDRQDDHFWGYESTHFPSYSA